MIFSFQFDTILCTKFTIFLDVLRHNLPAGVDFELKSVSEWSLSSWMFVIPVSLICYCFILVFTVELLNWWLCENDYSLPLIRVHVNILVNNADILIKGASIIKYIMIYPSIWEQVHRKCIRILKCHFSIQKSHLTSSSEISKFMKCFVKQNGKKKILIWWFF